MAGKQRIKAQLNGKSYTIISSYSQNHMQAVTDILAKELEQIQIQWPELSAEDAALLLAINATSKQLLTTLEKEPDELKSTIEGYEPFTKKTKDVVKEKKQTTPEKLKTKANKASKKTATRSIKTNKKADQTSSTINKKNSSNDASIEAGVDAAKSDEQVLEAIKTKNKIAGQQIRSKEKQVKK